MRVFDDVADLAQAVGDHLGYSEWLTISSAYVELFARAINYQHPPSSVGDPNVVDGQVVLAAVPRLAAGAYRVRGVRMGINSGCDRVRFPHPVRIGSRIRASVELHDVRRTDRGFRVATRVAVQIEGVEEPACTAELVSVLFDAPPVGPGR